MKSNGIKFVVGTKFRGNVNGYEFEVTKIEKDHTYVKVTKATEKKHLNKIHVHSIKHLEQLLVTEI